MPLFCLPMANISPGQVVALKDGQHATVRYVGTTQFAEGLWIGVELEGPTGKNDGSVAGERYFDCKPLYGMFLRPVGIARVLEHSARAGKTAAKETSNGNKGRPQSSIVSGSAGVRRTSTLPPKRNSTSTASSSIFHPKVPSPQVCCVFLKSCLASC